ncbi:hypothetical protein T03_120 [Trichinella britovi]|uniref:Uncharacterized protein n=1 Tax=Trichinella britovi TaxID=45882 RepID=A0A0V1D9E8_TRIBR|nr:hypothetical protein T03_120 [Trichinella britovi]
MTTTKADEHKIQKKKKNQKTKRVKRKEEEEKREKPVYLANGKTRAQRILTLLGFQSNELSNSIPSVASKLSHVKALLIDRQTDTDFSITSTIYINQQSNLLNVCSVRVPSGERGRNGPVNGQQIEGRLDVMWCRSAAREKGGVPGTRPGVRMTTNIHSVDQENNDHYKKRSLFAGWRPLSRRPVYTGLIGCAKIDQAFYY